MPSIAFILTVVTKYVEFGVPEQLKAMLPPHLLYNVIAGHFNILNPL